LTLIAEHELIVMTNAAQPLYHRQPIAAPRQEGAYDVVVRAVPVGQAPIERVVQFVVFDPDVIAPVRPLDRSEPVELDAAQPLTGERWYSPQRLLPRTTRLWHSMRHRFGAAEHVAEPATNVWRLNVRNTGRPHLVRIEYEHREPLLLAATISEQDPAGRWVKQPASSGVKSSEASVGPQAHEIVFWPETNTPSLSIYAEGAALTTVKKVRLFELPAGLEPLAVREPDGSRRLLALYLDGRDGWQSFGASRVAESSGSLAVDDWRTFLDATGRAAEYAQFAGYNCLEVTVAGGGGCLYPSTMLEPDLRFDSGSLADAAPDPQPKDLVELLFRMGRRHRLGVVPVLRPDGPMSALDQKIAEADARASGLVLVSQDGRLWEEQPGQARRYNPLNPDVQGALLQVVREFVGRYAEQPGFELLALDLAAESHWVLPGPEWGYDDRTVAQFAAEMGLVLPAGSGDPAARFAQRAVLLGGPERERWTAWRCRQLAGLYERVLAELQQAKSQGRVALSLTALSGRGADDLHKALRQGRTVEDLLRARGLDLRNWTVPADIIVLRPFAATGAAPEAMHLNSSRELEDMLAKVAQRGAVCLHEPELLRLTPTSGEQNRPGSPVDGLAVPLLPAGRASLRRFAQAMASADCRIISDGGRALPLGQEQLERDFARVFRSLPPAEFQPTETLQPVVVRSRNDARDTFLYLVNDATYPIETGLSFHCPAQTTLRNAATGDKLALKPGEDGPGIRLVLEPLETVALRLSQPDAAIAQCNVIATAAEKRLKTRFDRISQAIAVLGRDATRTIEGLPANGDFEHALGGDVVPAHWTGDGHTVQCALDRETIHGGLASLRLAGAAGDAVVSDSFAPPGGRALALNVWLRADEPGQRLRWFLVGNRSGEPVYRCFADVLLKTTWDQKQFRARDLPDGLVDDVLIKFQLLDPGTVWIDEARVCALPISSDEQRAISKSVAAIFKAWKERRWSDFERLADGYWATYLVESVEGSEIEN
jgi:hypothetical protein